MTERIFRAPNSDLRIVGWGVRPRQPRQPRPRRTRGEWLLTYAPKMDWYGLAAQAQQQAQQRQQQAQQRPDGASEQAPFPAA